MGKPSCRRVIQSRTQKANGAVGCDKSRTEQIEVDSESRDVYVGCRPGKAAETKLWCKNDDRDRAKQIVRGSEKYILRDSAWDTRGERGGG